ncbi:MAG: hypothetical protein ABEK10_00410 [Candidatus Nanosalina sp.]
MNAMPEIFEKSEENQENIPNPEDIGLDILLDNVITGSGIPSGDQELVGQEEVYDQAMLVARSAEQNPEVIERRQQIFKYFQENQDLTDFLLNARFPNPDKNKGFGSKHWDWTLENTEEMAESYISTVKGVRERIDDEAPEPVEEYAEELDKFIESGGFQEIDELMEDLRAPTETSMEISLSMNNEHWDDSWDTRGSSRIKSELQSGRKGVTGDRSSDRSSWDLGFPYSSLLQEIVDEVEEKTGVRARLWEAPIDIDLQLDEEERNLEATASVERKSIPSYISNLVTGNRETEEVEVDLDLSYEDISDIETEKRDGEWEEVKTHEAERAIRKAKYEALNHSLKREYRNRVREDLDSIAELKYLAAAARYANQKEAVGTPMVFPEVTDEGTSIEGMLEPNLVEQEGHEDIVSNDVNSDSEEYLHLITGANNGGKTTYMNAVGLAQAMYQMGMPVMAENAEMSPKDAILTHYIQQGDIQRGESRYANELERIQDVFEKSTPESMVLIDEPFSGTAPEEGAWQLDGVLKAFENLGSTTYASTHYHSVEVPEEGQTVPELVEGRENSRNLHAKVEEGGEGLGYTYRIQPGYSTFSEGRQVAREMGADPESLVAKLEEREDISL